MQILAWALPSGFLSSVVAWLVTRRQRNNDFLASLQKSIDLLTEKYTETLDENVRLQADNRLRALLLIVISESIFLLTGIFKFRHSFISS